MKRLSFVLTLLLLINYLNSSSVNYLPNILVVKFNEKYCSKDILQLEPIIKDKLESFLGNVEISPFFNPKLIDYGLVRHRQYFKTYEENHFLSLKRIYIIKYEKNIDALLASKKIANFDYFEYVQPYYLPKIFETPNDPFLSGQYSLRKIQAFEAWNTLSGSEDTIIVAIVDTGVDIDHEDLKDNIFLNKGEIGLDSLGRDKSSNGVDDDGNGFIDDYVGWDFAGTNGENQDNNPRPGNGHGTHVAGIVGAIINNGIGISGIVPKVQILPVKSASDETFSTYITKGYDGILYAGVMGAKVINCSWGSESGSGLENDVIKAVNNLGACVVAAAGNDGKYSDFVPASLNGVLSVAAVDSNDVKAGFSNFSLNVGVSAPGVKILSTTPSNNYSSWDGTSMASPVAAGVVALARQKFPHLNYEQIYGLVKSCSDNIDSLNPMYIGQIGSGRVNAYKVLNCNPDTVRSVALNLFSFEDFDGDGLLLPSDTVNIFLILKNVLADLYGVYIKLPTEISYISSIYREISYIGNLPRFSKIITSEPLIFQLDKNLPYDFTLKIPLDVYDSLGFLERFYVELAVNPSYRRMSFNNISITFNSRGNIGFNDYPQNKQGIGFVYKNGPNVLFEGGLLIGVDGSRVYDVVRSSNQSRQSNNFIPDTIFNINFDKNLNCFIGKTSFKTNPDSLLKSEFYINCNVYQPLGENDSNIVFLNYKVRNNTGKNLDSLFVGLFFDWDIGISGQGDLCVFDLDYKFAYAYNKDNTSLPFVGVKILDDIPVNFYAIDNDGRGEDSLGIYDGFTKWEKWMMLTSGIKRKKSRSTDASMLISGGPIKLFQDSIANINFALFAAEDIFSLRKTSVYSSELANKLNIIKSKPREEYLPFEVTLFPNPGENDFTIRISFLELVPVEIRIFDQSGRVINFYSYEENIPWTIEKELGLKNKSSGNYFVSVISKYGERTFLLSKVR